VYFTAVRPALDALREGGLRVLQDGGRIVVSTEHYAVTHDAEKMGGLPSRIEFRGAPGKVFDTFALNDRVHDPKSGGFSLRHDRQARVEAVGRGPVAATVTVRARYAKEDGARPPSEPEAAYTFVYCAGSPIVQVSANVSQRQSFPWNELHVLEINFRDQSFTMWAAGEPLATGPFAGDDKSHGGAQWGALADGNNVLGICGGDRAIVYDGKGYGRYLHGPWVQWHETTRTVATSLWIGNTPEGAKAVQSAAQGGAGVHARVTLPALEERLAHIRGKAAALSNGARRGRFAWALAQVTRRAEAGAVEEVAGLVERLGKAPADGKDAAEAVPWFGASASGLRLVDNGRVGLGFETAGSGVRLVSFYDFALERELLAEASPPLWRMELRGPGGETVVVDGTRGWGDAALRPDGDGKWELRWRRLDDARLAGIEVRCGVRLEGARSSWDLRVENGSKTWSVWRVRFPQVSPGRMSAAAQDDRLVTAAASGELIAGPATRTFRYHSQYPSGWGAMQFFAQYGREGGLYIGLHDPLAATKDLFAEHEAGAAAALCAIETPAENMGTAGNGFRAPGPAVLEAFQGDWFDAAQIYRQWMEREAKWRPAEDRRDTPRWMHDVSVWALASGTSKDVVGPVKAFAEYMGVPTAVHWYNWHAIPFDNDYPHYFPTKPGFADGVRELQAAGVRVMPYINGRLWDTDLDDFKTEAVKSATKDEQGKPYTEEYGSKQKLAPMCPVTPLWQRTVSDIVLRLLGPECGVDGVYIDQVAAAAPRLCYDASHGHPLGGGHWWTKDGYWPMLSKLRDDIKRRHPEKMLTTECNAEPFVQLFDGYLTWHFQYQNQIPLFAAVYGGKVQMFGRAYRGGKTKDLALRMKAAQSLVFGEQIGWLDPNVIKDAVGGPYVRRVARLRYALRDYLADGEMARPPQLAGDIPAVTADWQWSGEWPVTTPALLSGAWRARDGRLALLFANVLEKEQSVELVFDGAAYGLKPGAALSVTPRTEAGPQAPAAENTSFRRRITLGAYEVLALEIAPRR
jgi:hypothetical protein